METLVEDKQFQDAVERSGMLIQKILSSIPAAHTSVVQLEVRFTADSCWFRLDFNVWMNQCRFVREPVKGPVHGWALCP